MPALALLLTILPALVGYFPVYCNPGHAADDATQARLIVIVRVVAVNQVVDPPLTDGPVPETPVGYRATLRVGRVVRGQAEIGEMLTMDLGGYLRTPGVDDTTPTFLATCNTHPSYALHPDGVYLLFLDEPARTETQADDHRRLVIPRSCHWSVHQIVAGGEHGEALAVRASTGMTSAAEPPAPVPLDDFLRQRRLLPSEVWP